MQKNGMQDSFIWQHAFNSTHEHSNNSVRLRSALEGFRARVEELLKALNSELPSLTIHDISHLDALWRVAGVISGEDYELNPAEVFVLGGAILLHDAAHVLAAYPDGKRSIKSTDEWKDLIAHNYDGVEPDTSSKSEEAALFQILRTLHASQAHSLAHQQWTSTQDGTPQFLLEDGELRRHYGDLIGKIAESHHWPAHRVATEFSSRFLSSPGNFQPDNWPVDALKVAFLLRTADAAHLDALRAPWFLFALQKPTGISADHWRFQGRMSQPTRTENGQLRISSGDPFPPSDRQAWWLAFDTGKMIDRELRDAKRIMIEHGRKPFAVTGVADIESSQAFQVNVPTVGWTPIDVAPKVGNVPNLISQLGGISLYGDDPRVALRELLQNSIDAIHALRRLGGLDALEGIIDVSLESDSEGYFWLNVTDNGIGMSRFVVTEVLLDFGRSLWNSNALREQLPGLAASGFSSIGRFGIGFFATFMLGEQVKVVTRRFEPAVGETLEQWVLEFESGLTDRPVLRNARSEERLKRSGTKVSVRLTEAKLEKLLDGFPHDYPSDLDTYLDEAEDIDIEPNDPPVAESLLEALSSLTAWQCPSSDVHIRVSIDDLPQVTSVAADDWKSLPDDALCARLGLPHAELFPLTNSRNELIGRLGPSAFHPSFGGSLNINGVRNGEMRGLAGVCQARAQSVSARRKDAMADGSRSDWQRWAKNVMDTRSLTAEFIGEFHRLFPDEDFAVWTLGGESANKQDLRRFVTDQNYVMLRDGDLVHEAQDGIIESKFSELMYVENLITHPSDWHYEVDLEPFLQVADIDYDAQFRHILDDIWGSYDWTFKKLAIGRIGEVEISRYVTVFSRVDAV